MESLTIQRIKLLIEREKETPNSFAKKIGVTVMLAQSNAKMLFENANIGPVKIEVRTARG